MHRGTVSLPMAEIIEFTRRDNNLYLQMRIRHPDHGTDAQAAIAAARRARVAMEQGLPQVGPGYMVSVAGQEMLLGAGGPILNIGIYDARDVQRACRQLGESLESDGWSGELTIVDYDTRAAATYIGANHMSSSSRPVTEAVFAEPRPAVTAPVAGRVVIDEPRIEHSWQEGMDRHYGWLRLECDPARLAEAAVAMANGLAEVIHRSGANITQPGDDDYLGLGPVQVSTVGPFVELEDIGDFPTLRRIMAYLGQYLEGDGIEGVLTILDYREGRP